MTTRRPTPKAGLRPSEQVMFRRRDLLLAMPLAGLGGVMASILTDAESWMPLWVVGSGFAIAVYLAIERFRPRA